MPPVGAHDRLVPRPGIEARAMADGALIVDLETGACWELNAVGSAAWTSFAAGDTVGAACRALAGRYDAAPEVIEADLRHLCDGLLAAGLLVPARAAP